MIPEAKDLLQQMKNGELGDERKKEIEKICGNKDLLEFATFYEMERQLWIALKDKNLTSR